MNEDVVTIELGAMRAAAVNRNRVRDIQHLNGDSSKKRLVAFAVRTPSGSKSHKVTAAPGWRMRLAMSRPMPCAFASNDSSLGGEVL